MRPHRCSICDAILDADDPEDDDVCLACAEIIGDAYDEMEAEDEDEDDGLG